MMACADYIQVPMYLDAAGQRNEDYYKKVGFEQVGERVKVDIEKKGGGRFNPDGIEGYAAMVRKAVVAERERERESESV